MHRTYSGNYGSFNALTYSVISSELMQRPGGGASFENAREGVTLPRRLSGGVSGLCAAAMREEPDQTALHTHTPLHTTAIVFYLFKKNNDNNNKKQSSTQKNLLFL